MKPDVSSRTGFSFLIAVIALNAAYIAATAAKRVDAQTNTTGATCDNQNTLCDTIRTGNVGPKQNPEAGGLGNQNNVCYYIDCTGSTAGSFPTGTCVPSRGGVCSQQRQTSTNSCNKCNYYAYPSATGACVSNIDPTTTGCDTNTGTLIGQGGKGVPAC